VVYRRHTNFSLETIELTFSGNAHFGKRVTCPITRNGDLVTRSYLKIQLPEIYSNDESQQDQEFAWAPRIGHALVRSMELEIGGTRVDKIYSEWLNVWMELTLPEGTSKGYKRMIGDYDELTKLRTPTYKGGKYVFCPAKTLYVPCQFWFSRNNGLALPLIALQYHEVKVVFQFRNFEDCIVHTSGFKCTPCEIDGTLMVDYVYLDTEERKRFAQVSHEYLIEQLQFTGEEPLNGSKYRLNFNHPCKTLFWFAHLDKFRSRKQFAYYTHDWESAAVATELDERVQYLNDAGLAKMGDEPITAEDLLTYPADSFVWNWNGVEEENRDLLFPYVVNQPNNMSLRLDGKGNGFNQSSLLLNGHDRTGSMSAIQTNYVQPFQHFPRTPCDGLNVYSFALNPAEHQPSGTCNFSRIDTAQLNLNWKPQNPRIQENGHIYIYAVNYNVLRIMSGMAGVAYCN